jgi:hypothetical protein
MQDKPVYTQAESDARVGRVLAWERRRKKLLEPAIVHVEPSGHRPSLALSSTPGLWEHFKVVPAEFYARERTAAMIVCPCGYVDPAIGEPPQLRIEFGALESCAGCGRFYFNGTRLHAANPGDAATIEHAHPYDQPCLPPCPEYA